MADPDLRGDASKPPLNRRRALIPSLLEINPSCGIVVLTGYASIATAVDSIKLEVVQYPARPVDVDTLLRAFGHSLQADQHTSTAAAPMSVDRMEWEPIHRAGADHASAQLATQASETTGQAAGLWRISAPLRTGRARRSAAGRFL